MCMFQRRGSETMKNYFSARARYERQYHAKWDRALMRSAGMSHCLNNDGSGFNVDLVWTERTTYQAKANAIRALQWHQRRNKQ